MFISRDWYLFLLASCGYAVIAFIGLLITEWVAPVTLGETLNDLAMAYPIELLFVFASMKYMERKNNE